MPAASADLVQQDGVAVGRRACGVGRGDHAAGAADVFDDDLLAEVCDMLSWMMRAIASVAPPGANGTISVIGRLG